MLNMKSMRRVDRQMVESEAKELLGRGEYGILAMIDEEGCPYGVPLNYVYNNDAVYVHCALQGKKLSAITANPQVCFTVVGSTQVLPDKFATNYESVMVFGPAVIVGAAEKEVALQAIVQRYSAEFLEAGHAYIEKFRAATQVVKINVELITGKRRAG
jgi:nitroimidazol reductase NimA-like FMN-containing flavoprotein (pyridoxamine 5'-phosphate oxidase superfamily)